MGQIMANVPQDVYGRFGVSKKDEDQINKGVHWSHSFCETGIRYYHGDNFNFGICYDMAKKPSSYCSWSYDESLVYLQL